MLHDYNRWIAGLDSGRHIRGDSVHASEEMSSDRGWLVSSPINKECVREETGNESLDGGTSMAEDTVVFIV